MANTKSIMGMLAFAGLVLGAGLTSAETPGGCKKGTTCRQLIENGYKTCQTAARDKWKAILAQCKAARRAGNTAACLQAIQDGYHTTFANGALRPEASSCPVGTIDCGTGVCCPADYPVCCTLTKCCPSAFPICGMDEFCHLDVSTTTTTITTTTTAPQCGTPTTLPGGECQNFGDPCSMNHCFGFPAGSCEVHCPGGDFVCIGLVAVYSNCSTDADCPPRDNPQLFDNTICITPGSETDPATCSNNHGVCSKPCN